MPEWVFAPASVTVPVPIFARAKPPEIALLMVRFPVPPMLLAAVRVVDESWAVALVPVPLPKVTAGAVA